MQSTKIILAIQKKLRNLLETFVSVSHLATLIHQNGGRALLVGGAVRDLLLDREVKDVDIELHGIAVDAVEPLLRQIGFVDYVGKSFGIFKVSPADEPSIDIALPRSDSGGRKPQVAVDPMMSLHDAFRRRDLTINAMGMDLYTGELIDLFGGYQDLQNKVLRAVDAEFFVQDPLRFYRVMQFVGRFEMEPDEQLNALCATMDVSTVSIERIEKEFEKLLLQSRAPSRGIRWLHRIGRLHELFPELGNLIGVVQSARWHPEGDVFEHSMQALDAAAAFTYSDADQKLTIMYAALCHDLGKVETTVIDGEFVTSYGHESVGAVLTKQLLKRITGKKNLIIVVVKLVACHMQPLQFVALKSGPAAYKRLARKLAPHATIAMLAQVARADILGRNPHKGTPLTGQTPEVDMFIQKSAELQILDKVELPVLLGRDLMPEVAPGPRLGELVKQAYEIQLNEGIVDKQELKRRVLGKKDAEKK
ncbi:MAG TPA: HD domain-containing protein [Candidatus Babeliales bacterium]|nr:HD domain-containing protein [Candidatus Babeliales bacterium]